MTRGEAVGNGRPSIDDRGVDWGDVLFKFAMDGKVVTGRDGWLFLDHDGNGYLQQFGGELKLSDQQLEEWRELLERRVARIGELGGSYHFLVAPESPPVYPEKLPDGIEMTGERTVQQLMRHLSATGSPAKLIYPVEELLAEKPARPVYRKTDSHWNDYGALVAYRRLMRELGQDVPRHEVGDEELEFYQSDIPGDLSYKLGIPPGPSWCARYLYSRADVLYDNCIDLSGSLVVTECPHAPPTTCVLFGDSSCWGMLAFLSQTFGRLVFAHSATVDYDLIAEERPDVVVSQMVERFLIVVPDDSAARPVREMEAEKRANERFRPRVQIWDPLPETSPDTRVPTLETVEMVRAHLLAQRRREDATFVSLMAYAGLSPSEALRLSWQQLENGNVDVAPAYANREGADSVELRRRSVRLLEPLADDLAAWRAASGSPRRGYVFPSLRTRSFPKWIQMDYLPAVRAAGRPGLSPTALCDTFGALLIEDGRSASEVGRLMGIERADVLSRYWPLMDETAAGVSPDSPADRILATRATSEAAVRPRLPGEAALLRLARALLPATGTEVAWGDALGVNPLSVETVERIRARFLYTGRHEEATFVSVMAYAALHQSEALQLKWRQLEDGVLELEGARTGFGSGEARKLRERSLPLLEPLAKDLADWRTACGEPQRGWVFPSLRRRDWQAWVQGEYRRAARQAGAGRSRPHSLRHTFCALLIDEGLALDEVARQIALSPKETLVQYGHLFEESHVRDRPIVGASARIRAARATVEASGRHGLGRALRRLKRSSSSPPRALTQSDAALSEDAQTSA